VFEKLSVRETESLATQQQQSVLKWHDHGFEATVTALGDSEDALIRMEGGPKMGKSLIVPIHDIKRIGIDEIVQPVVFESRSSANLSKIREFLLKIFGGSTLNQNFVDAMKRFRERKEKDGSEGFWNDHHIVMLQDEAFEQELDKLLGGSDGIPGRTLGREFRLLCLDAVHKKEIQGPNNASAAEIETAAATCRLHQGSDARMPYGTYTQCQQWWLRHRNIDLDKNNLQRAVQKLLDAERPRAKRGARQRMSDYTFAKYVVPVMRSTGNLLAPLSTWRRVMSAIHLMEQGLVDAAEDAQGNVRVDGGCGLVRQVWKGALPDADTDWPKDDHTAGEYLARFGLSDRTGEELGAHRLAVDADCVEDVFNTLEERIRELDIKKVTQILLTDELREHKDFERVREALKVVADSEDKRSFVQALEKLTAGATAVPVTDLIGNVKILQFVCVDTNGSTRVNPEEVVAACRRAGFDCRILVSYSETGYATGATNSELKKALIEVLGRELNPLWTPGFTFLFFVFVYLVSV
jgi:hypothetical protein